MVAWTWLSGRRSRPPLLSVVVPVYNSDLYLADCLDSLFGQTLRDIEVIAVDDGSTDGSAAILSRYEARHGERLRVVRQANAGLGAARNAGTAMARGTYLTFVDSDDTVPLDAFGRLVGSLESTGSDFASGALDRIGARAPAIKGTMREVHASARPATTLAEFPLAVYDIFCCTKVFRTAFWRTNDLAFPVGIRYEDQVPCVRAYLAADRFDVLTDVTYHWRLRDEGGSITQTTAELATLRDRSQVSREVLDLLGARPDLRAVWLSRRVVGNDLRLYARHLRHATDEYWAELHGWAVAALAGVDLSELDAPARQIDLARALVDGDRTAAEQLLAPR